MKTAIVVGANSLPGRRIVGRLASAGVAVVAAGFGLPPAIPMREGIARIRDAGTAGESGPVDVS